MRKVLLFILVIILLGIIFLLASPVYYGKQAQFFINKAVVSANQNYGKYGVLASIDSYQRNWYTSTAVIDITVDNYKFKRFYKQYVDPNFNLSAPLVYKDVITVLHGPINYHFIGGGPFTAAYVEGHVELPADLKQRLQLKAPLLVFDGRISYTDVFAGHIVIPALSYESPKLALKWNGLSFFGNVSADLSHIAGEYTIQPTRFSLKNFKNNIDLTMIVSPMQTHFDFRRTPGGLWVGHTQGVIQNEKIIFTSKAGQKPYDEVISYKNISTHMSLTLNKNDYSLAYVVKMGDYNAFSTVNVKNIMVNMELDNLNASVMQTIQDIILRHLFIRGDLPVNQNAMGQVMGLLPKLITQKTQIKINDISFDLPKGSVALQGEFSWPQYEAGMPVFTIGLLTHASLHVSVGKVLLDQLIAQINQQAKEQAAALPAMEPGPVILPANHSPVAKSAVVKPVAVAKTTPLASTSAISPYMSEMGQVGGLLKYCLQQGYVVEKDQAYQTQLNYSAGAFTANGKKVRL